MLDFFKHQAPAMPLLGPVVASQPLIYELPTNYTVANYYSKRQKKRLPATYSLIDLMVYPDGHYNFATLAAFDLKDLYTAQTTRSIAELTTTPAREDVHEYFIGLIIDPCINTHNAQAVRELSQKLSHWSSASFTHHHGVDAHYIVTINANSAQYELLDHTAQDTRLHFAEHNSGTIPLDHSHSA